MKNKVSISILIATILSLSIIFFFIKNSYKFFDYSGEAKARLDSYIDNPYTLSIKENVTEKDLEDTMNIISKIPDSKTREELEEKYKVLIGEIRLQGSLKSKIENIYNNTNLPSEKSSELAEIKNSISKIRNDKIRLDLLKKISEIIDRIEHTENVVAKAEKLNNEDLGLYYEVKSMNEYIFYTSIKDAINKKLESTYKDIQEKKANDSVEEAATIEEEAKKRLSESIPSGESKVEVRTSTPSSVLIRFEAKLFDKAVIIKDQKLYLYSYEETKRNSHQYVTKLIATITPKSIDSNILSAGTLLTSSSRYEKGIAFGDNKVKITTDSSEDRAILVSENDLSTITTFINSGKIGGGLYVEA